MPDPIVTLDDSQNNTAESAVKSAPTVADFEQMLDSWSSWWNCKINDWSKSLNKPTTHLCICCQSRPVWPTGKSSFSLVCPACGLALNALKAIQGGDKETAKQYISHMSDVAERDFPNVIDNHLWETMFGPVADYVSSSETVSREGVLTACGVRWIDFTEGEPFPDTQTNLIQSAYELLEWLMTERSIHDAKQRSEQAKTAFSRTIAEMMADGAHILAMFEPYTVEPKEWVRRVERAVTRAYEGSKPPFDSQQFWDALTTPIPGWFETDAGGDNRAAWSVAPIVLRWMPYQNYLKTPHWQTTRNAALERAGHRCQVCNATASLHTHHRTYERRGAEQPEDLIVLCRKCHETFHKNGRLAR